MSVRTELTVRATQSGPIQFQLLSGTVPVDLSAVGTVELWLKDQAGGTSMTDNLTGKLAINGAAGGSVQWTPGTADLVAGSASYHGYFKVYNSPTSWDFYPEDSEITVHVRAKY